MILLRQPNSEHHLLSISNSYPRTSLLILDHGVAGAVDAAVARHGRLDVMFNNAGIVGSLSGTSEAASLDLGEFDRVMAVNVRGTMAGIKHAMQIGRAHV